MPIPVYVDINVAVKGINQINKAFSNLANQTKNISKEATAQSAKWEFSAAKLTNRYRTNAELFDILRKNTEKVAYAQQTGIDVQKVFTKEIYDSNKAAEILKSRGIGGVDKMINQTIASTKRFKMEWLSIMFFGMFLQRVFGGFFKTMLNTFKTIDKKGVTPLSRAMTRLHASFTFLQFSIVQAMQPFLLGLIDMAVSFFDWISNWPLELKVALVILIGILGVLGTIAFISGTLELAWGALASVLTAAGLGSIVKALGGAKAKIGGVLAKPIKIGVQFTKDLASKLSEFASNLESSLLSTKWGKWGLFAAGTGLIVHASLNFDKVSGTATIQDDIITWAETALGGYFIARSALSLGKKQAALFGVGVALAFVAAGNSKDTNLAKMITSAAELALGSAFVASSALGAGLAGAALFGVGVGLVWLVGKFPSLDELIFGKGEISRQRKVYPEIDILKKSEESLSGLATEFEKSGPLGGLVSGILIRPAAWLESVFGAGAAAHRKWWEFGNEISKSVVKGIVANAEKNGQKIDKDFLSVIDERFPSSPPKAGPLANPTPFVRGQLLVIQFVQGILKQADLLKMALASVFGSAMKAAYDAFHSYIEAMVAEVNRMIEAIKALQAARASAYASAPGNVSISQTVNVNGAQDVNAVARAVEDALNKVAYNVKRNT